MKLLLIIIFILIVLLLLSMLVKSFKTTGGYDGVKFQPASKQPNPNDYMKNTTLGQDTFFKSLLYDKYKNKVISGIVVNGFVPKSISYIEGGFMNTDEISDIARQRVKLNEDADFEPDFVVKFNNDILIIECDEGGEYHQDSNNFRYQTKNLIYSKILHSSEENQNIVILRICYNNGVNKISKKKRDRDHRKEYTIRHVEKCVDFVIDNMIKGKIKDQYVLMKIEADNTKLALLEYKTRVKEIVGIIAKNRDQFEIDYSYFRIDLNTRTYFDRNESCEDNFKIVYYFKCK